MYHQYAAILETNQDGELAVSFPYFPGCVTVSDWEHVHLLVVEALQFHINGMIQDGQDIFVEENNFVQLHDAINFAEENDININAIILVTVQIPEPRR